MSRGSELVLDQTGGRATCRAHWFETATCCRFWLRVFVLVRKGDAWSLAIFLDAVCCVIDQIDNTVRQRNIAAQHAKQGGQMFISRRLATERVRAGYELSQNADDLLSRY